MKITFKKKLGLAAAVAAALSSVSISTIAQTPEQADQADNTEVIEVTGIRSALASALNEKRNSANLKEVIKSEDIGKLPDQNLAEVLENVTGIQIDRTAGVGTGVSIRGTGANRVEINGVATVSDGNDRGGISFDDLPAALIESVEVIKVPEASTVEGSVGGTINLRTLRGLSLQKMLLSVRLQAENSDLAESTTPRISGTFGNKFKTSAGDLGIVLTGSYAEQDVASFDPRFDRDREVLPDSGRASAETFPFLRTQFLDQQLASFAYETKNLTGSIEFQPRDDLRVYADITINQQEQAQQSSRAFFSGIGSNAPVDNTTNTAFETINLGSVDGPNGMLNLGNVQAVLRGVVDVGVDPRNSNIDTNLRISGNTGSRVTDSQVFAFGGEWTRDKLQLTAEVSYSESDNIFPSLNTTLDFINPNGPQPGFGLSNDNGVPAEFDASGDTLQFGIAQGLATTPSSSDLLTPANYALRQINRGLNTRKNSDTAFRVDAVYDISDTNDFFVDIKAGLRWNSNSAETQGNDSNVNFTNESNEFFRPRADLFASIITAGPDNFNAADNRRLFVRDYLMVDNNLAFNNPQGVLSELEAAITANNVINAANGNALTPTFAEPALDLGSFFEIEEETTALYVQGDFDFEAGNIPIRGNIGVRYVQTDLTSIGNNIENNAQGQEVVSSQSNETSDYSFLLPRFNIVASVTDELVLRGGIAKDINRPTFNNLSTSIRFGGNAGAAVSRGNPQLQPETVLSFDLSAEYYLSSSSLFSVGVFHKIRTDIFTPVRNNPAEPISAGGQIERDITAPCEGGGIFNPAVTDRNVWSSVQEGAGICVPLQTTINVANDETQTGIELSAQYDLSEFEDSLGWASGFGIIANYTYQEAGADLDAFRPATGDANALNRLLGRTDGDQSTATLDDDIVEERIQLTGLSENAYNFTLFYDKYDISVRMRYTYRDAFRTNDLISFDMPRIVGARGQLNMSASYDINEQVTIGVDGVNLTREDRPEWCVNEGALLCSQGLTDRRVVFGLTGRF